MRGQDSSLTMSSMYHGAQPLVRTGSISSYLCIFDFIPVCTPGTEQVARYVVTRSTRTGEGRYCGETVTAMVDAVSCMLCLDIHRIASVVVCLISICRQLQVCNLNPAILDNLNFHAHRQCRY